MASVSEMLKLVRRAEKAGLIVTRRGSGHYKVENPDTGEWFSMPFSPRKQGTIRRCHEQVNRMIDKRT